MKSIGPAELRALIEAAAAAVIAERAQLNRLDAALGDGDHGSSVSAAFALAVEKIAALAEPSLSDMWLATAMAMLNGMGGASGALFGTFFLKGAPQLRGVERLDKDGLSQLFVAGLAGVKERGGARLGDKTMVDALEPAVCAFAGAAAFEFGWHSAASAAIRGANATAGFRPRLGRARYLGERALGHKDPGAVTISIMFMALDNCWQDMLKNSHKGTETQR